MTGPSASRPARPPSDPTGTREPASDGDGAAVLVLADDLIWASRLCAAVARAGAHPVRLASGSELEVALAAVELAEPRGPSDRSKPPNGAVVDLNGRRYEGVAAVGRIRAAGLPVIAVAQHDDQVTRRRALDAGATRVFSYATFFAHGPRLVAAWLVRVTRAP
jgi:DNA-binding response OmpR family regulator